MTTVGYGDIVPYTLIERIFALLVMAFGVGFYSYVISNLSSIIDQIDKRKRYLKAKLTALKALADSTNLPLGLQRRIRSHIKTTHEENRLN